MGRLKTRDLTLRDWTGVVRSRDVHPCDMVLRCPVSRCQVSIFQRPRFNVAAYHLNSGVFKGTPGDAKCVTEIAGGGTKPGNWGGDKNIVLIQEKISALNALIIMSNML